MTATFHCLKMLLPVGVSSVFAHRVAAHFCLRASPAGRRCRRGVQAEPNSVGVGSLRRRWRGGRFVPIVLGCATTRATDDGSVTKDDYYRRRMTIFT